MIRTKWGWAIARPGMTAVSADENFLNRWSRRKLEGGADVVPDAPPEAEADAVPEAEAEPEAPPDLPDIDGLDKDSDFTPFMADGVPEELKRLALRKLWLSDPVLANLDGLNDYDEDFGAIVKAGAEFMNNLKLQQEEAARIDKAVDNFVDEEGEEESDGGFEPIAGAPDAEPETGTATVENTEPVDTEQGSGAADEGEQA